MRVYCVGGYVRDKILGLKSFDRDWVVVGSDEKTMLKLGFRKIGESFPVFLDPINNQEFALARTESKNGVGYHGFSFDFNSKVTLEQDVSRRDITINSLAMDSSGEIIDYCGGLEDIKNKIIKHISPAFAEDPLRLVRVARFHARFFNLGFQVAEDTIKLLLNISQSKEILHISRNRLVNEIELGMGGSRPDVFVKTLGRCKALEQVFGFEIECKDIGIFFNNNLFDIKNIPTKSKFYINFAIFVFESNTIKSKEKAQNFSIENFVKTLKELKFENKTIDFVLLVYTVNFLFCTYSNLEIFCKIQIIKAFGLVAKMLKIHKEETNIVVECLFAKDRCKINDLYNFIDLFIKLKPDKNISQKEIGSHMKNKKEKLIDKFIGNIQK